MSFSSSNSSFNSSTNNTSTFESNISSFNKNSYKNIQDIEKKVDELQTFIEKDPFKNHDIQLLSWILFDNYFSKNKLTEHHIESYNKFIDTYIPNILQNDNPIIVRERYNKHKKRYMDEWHIEFDNIIISQPGIKENDSSVKLLYPAEARWRNLTYASYLYFDVKQKYVSYTDDSDIPIIKEFDVIKKKISLQIMVQSKHCPLNNLPSRIRAEKGECEYDQGGYFIVNGQEKVLISQERKCENKILAFSQNTQTSFSDTVEIMSVSYKNDITRSTRCKIYRKTKNTTVQVFIQRFKNDHPFPVFIVFRALGIISDKDIVEMILFNPLSEKNKNAFHILKNSIEEASHIQSQKIALNDMAKYITKFPELKEMNEDEEIFRQNYVLKLLQDELFPHIGKNLLQKAWFLGFMVKKLLYTSLGIKKYDDRDSFMNKRINTSGALMKELFKNNINKLLKDITKDVEKNMRDGKIDEIYSSVGKKLSNGTKNIESSTRFALGTGTWGMQSQSSISKKGIAQPLSRLNYPSTISHLRRVNAPQAESGSKMIEPRKLHSTQWMRLCPSETPDGSSIGIIKNLSMMTYVTVGYDDISVYNVLYKLHIYITQIQDINPKEMETLVCIFINGSPYGVTKYPNKVVSILRYMRRNTGDINKYTSISWNKEDQEIHINTEDGRLCRPLFVVKNNRLLITLQDFQDILYSKKNWKNLMEEGKIEYIDVEEEDTSMVAMSYKDLLSNTDKNHTFIRYTHCEIHPVMMFGASVITIPFAEHNPTIRIMYEAAQKKQALSVYATNYRTRMDNSGQVLIYPQTCLVSTKPSQYLYEKDLPSGQNVIVAIACFTGYNQEDSLIMNQNSIERGMFSSLYYKTYKDSEKKNQASLEEEKFCKPVKFNPNGTLRTAGMKPGSYDLLDENGFVKLGSFVKEGDVIIGKVIPIKNISGSGPKFKDASVVIGPNVSGYVDTVYVNKDNDSYQFVKVRIRSIRTPTIGDKFSSRFGQKGTIGMVYRQEDMPYTMEGVRPDIIVNSSAIPSRMTLGQLLETVIGKAACIKGFEFDATPFCNNDPENTEKIASILESCHFERYGKEQMYNPKNGTKMESKIFIGPTYYQKLKHMSKDKIHARATGPLQNLTRQPPEGRVRDGGLRFGEMERDCMIGYAASGIVKEKMFDCSDEYVFYVCDSCGHIAISNPSKSIFTCLSCKDKNTSFSQVQVPYASKLFFQELISIGVVPRIFTK